MKKKEELTLPEDIFYTGEHLWVRPGSELWEVGISDFGQDQLGGVVFVDLPAQGSAWQTGDEFGNVESVKAVNGLFMPLDGEIVEVNSALEDDPALINSSSYGDGWLVKIRPANPKALAELMKAEAYRDSLE